MNQLWIFIKKETIHIVRDIRTLTVLLIMPLAQILIFGYVITTEVNNARIGIYDKANDFTSRQVTDRMVSSGYFNVEKYFRNEQEMKEALRRGEIRMAVVFLQSLAILWSRQTVQTFNL